MQHDPNLIRIFDKYGRELFLTKEEWRTNVLPGNIQSNWDDPDGLYGIIVQALNDGMHADVAKAAEQLYRIDTLPDRGATILGIVHMKNGRLDEAEKVLRSFISAHGEEGVILTNLAKVASARGDEAKAEAILWHALELDPNQDNGMGWYCSIRRERGGEEAATQALRKIAAIPGSWRAQTWLAREEVQAGRLDEALNLYRESLARVAKPVPGDLLEQMSGDLGNAGRLSELLQLCEPHFAPEVHGLWVGNNLIKANLDLGRIERAREILNQLFALKRPDWQENLNYWDIEIAKKRVVQSPVPKTAAKASMLAFEGPIWLKRDSPGADLFPKKAPGGLGICFLGSTAEVPGTAKEIEHQLADSRGRLSRAVPLFLAEQIDLTSNATARVLIPWLNQQGSEGFILGGAAWGDATAVRHAMAGESASDYVVTTHLKTQAEPWQVALRLIRTKDGRCVGELSASFHSEKPQAAIPQLGRDLLTLLAEHAGVASAPPAAPYQVPAGPQFAYYLLRLEQLLAVRSDGGNLNGEREIIDGNVQLCLDCPQNVTVRLLLANTVLAMKKARPDILPEFQDKLGALLKDHPLPGPPQYVIRKILNEALAA